MTQKPELESRFVSGGFVFFLKTAVNTPGKNTFKNHGPYLRDSGKEISVICD